MPNKPSQFQICLFVIGGAHIGTEIRLDSERRQILFPLDTALFGIIEFPRIALRLRRSPAPEAASHRPPLPPYRQKIPPGCPPGFCPSALHPESCRLRYRRSTFVSPDAGCLHGRTLLFKMFHNNLIRQHPDLFIPVFFSRIHDKNVINRVFLYQQSFYKFPEFFPGWYVGIITSTDFGIFTSPIKTAAAQHKSLYACATAVLYLIMNPPEARHPRNWTEYLPLRIR